MTKKKWLHVQQKIEIMQLPDGERFKSLIQELDGETVSVTVPYRQGKYLFLHSGEMVRVEFADNDAIYGFQAKVLGRRKSNHVPLVLLSRPAFFTRKQRRSFVRFPITLPVRFYLNPQSGGQLIPESCEEKTGKTIDISGGGLQIYTSSAVQAGTQVLLRLKLNDGHPQELILGGNISWVTEDQWHRSVRFGVCFQGISEAAQERIISYVFSMMRQRTLT
ncbi:MAG: PilZ domain-containing protein [Dethiobacter sp.]|jgi:c-di-GMP-binding flagellar brake protein YcgR|nr:PilZ domain-containing protein [Dethiobacter sp.]MBS3902196.1 PilZ domain-containing protein [Dethiobacter sp.]MBS3990022.1 PilZ domain-containing protein [Dethiobacter sp.]